MRRDPAKAKKTFSFFYTRLKPLGVFDQLQLTPRVELVALVALLQGGLKNWREDRYVREQMKKAPSEAPRRIRMLRSKLRNAVLALRDLGQYVETLREHLLGETILGWGMTIPSDERIPTPEELFADAARYEKMRPLTMAEIKADIEQIREGTLEPLTRASVRDDAIARLDAFFVAGCKLSQAEADLRVGKIVNTFLGSNVRVVEQNVGAKTGRGAEAISSRRRRLAKKTVTPRKTS